MANNIGPSAGQTNVEQLLAWQATRTLAAGYDADARTVTSLGLVGAGVMGIEITALHVRRGVKVVITDIDAATRDRVPSRIADELESAGVAGDDAQEIVARLVQTTDGDVEVAACDLVLESIPEDVPLKRDLYARLEPQLGSQTILATNTSTIPIGMLAADLKRPERFCAVHFCHPVRARRLVEIIPGPLTSRPTLATAIAHAQAIGQLPVVVNDGPGFLINRLLVRFTNEAMNLLADGATIADVDAAATDFGFAKGPLQLMDEIGLDTALHGGKLLRDAYSFRVLPAPLLVLLFKRGHLGQKAGRGFYLYPPGGDGPAGVNPEAAALAAHLVQTDKRLSRDAILDRLLLAMLLEATLIVDEGQVQDPRDVDLGLLFGLGYPAAHGGLLFWADTRGAAAVLEKLRPLADLGARFQPTPRLMQMAEQGMRFY